MRGQGATVSPGLVVIPVRTGLPGPMDAAEAAHMDRRWPSVARLREVSIVYATMLRTCSIVRAEDTCNRYSHPNGREFSAAGEALTELARAPGLTPMSVIGRSAWMPPHGDEWIARQ
jgi:hypothetical protein